MSIIDMQMQPPALEAFYNLKKKIVELSVDDEIAMSLMECISALEHELTGTKSESAPSLEEIDMILYRHREPQQTKINSNVAGPSQKTQEFAQKEHIQSARKIDWLIAYGKACDARCNLAEAEAEEKRLSDLYLKYTY